MFLSLPTLQQEQASNDMRGSIIQGVGITGDYTALTDGAQGHGQPQQAESPRKLARATSSVNTDELEEGDEEKDGSKVSSMDEDGSSCVDVHS